MNCDECNRLHAEAASSWQAYLAEKHLNQSRCTELSERHMQQQADLLRVYRLAAARQRVHRGKAHPEDGHVIRIEDLQLVSGQEMEA
jgi:hypothetical protein